MWGDRNGGPCKHLCGYGVCFFASLLRLGPSWRTDLEQSLGGDLARLLICRTNTSVRFVSICLELLKQPNVVAKLFTSLVVRDVYLRWDVVYRIENANEITLTLVIKRFGVFVTFKRLVLYRGKQLKYSCKTAAYLHIEMI